MGLFTRDRLPYEPVASEELDERAAQLVLRGAIAVSYIDDPDAPSLRVDGPCARCEHPYSQTTVLAVPDWAIRAVSGPQPKPAPSAEFLCDCRDPHPNTPPRMRGCGASYQITAPRPEHD